jgi:hypothetical protein
MAFDVEGAKRAGYSDAEITQHLKSKGMSPAEIASTLAPAAGDGTPGVMLGRSNTAAGPPGGMQWTPEGMEITPAPAPGLGMTTPTATALEGAVGRVGQAAAEGFQASPFLTEEAKAAAEARNNQTPVGRYVTSPLVSLGELPFRGMNAVGAGVGQGAYEVGNAIGGPRLGRDAFQMNQPMQTMLAAAPGIMGGGRQPVQRPTPRFAGEYYGERPPGSPPVIRLEEVTQAVRDAPSSAPERWRPVAPGEEPQPGRQYRMNQTTGQREVNEGGSGPVPPRGVPEPEAGASQPVPEGRTADPGQGTQATGAQVTPSSAAEMTPAEVKANRRQAEINDLDAPAELGDTRIYVKGSLPTRAEYSGDPVVSQQERLIRERNPNAFEGSQGRLTENMEARVAHYDELTPSDPRLQSMEDARARQAAADEAAIIPNAKPVDLGPALRVYDEVLNSPRNIERDAVMSVLKPLRDKLFDADGNLKSDPQSVWGMHDNLRNKLDTAKDRTSTEKYVITELNRFKKAIDDAMNVATDNRFQTFLDNYAGASRDINVGRILQAQRGSIINSKGEFLPNQFHKFVRDLAMRRGEKGVDAAMDIPDATMEKLIALDKDLKRAGLIDLGKSRGSPTNLYGELAKGMGLAGAHAVTGLVAGGIPNLLLQQAASGVNRMGGRLLLERRTRQHLNPPPGGYNDLYRPTETPPPAP